MTTHNMRARAGFGHLPPELDHTMTLNDQKNLYSLGWVQSIAAASGANVVGSPVIDDDSIDITLSRRGGSGPRRSPHLSLQLKCTQNLPSSAAGLSYPLPLKNY